MENGWKMKVFLFFFRNLFGFISSGARNYLKCVPRNVQFPLSLKSAVILLLHLYEVTGYFQV